MSTSDISSPARARRDGSANRSTARSAGSHWNSSASSPTSPTSARISDFGSWNCSQSRSVLNSRTSRVSSAISGSGTVALLVLESARVPQAWPSPTHAVASGHDEAPRSGGTTGLRRPPAGPAGGSGPAELSGASDVRVLAVGVRGRLGGRRDRRLGGVSRLGGRRVGGSRLVVAAGVLTLGGAGLGLGRDLLTVDAAVTRVHRDTLAERGRCRHVGRARVGRLG